jgi:hypothetical protein
VASASQSAACVGATARGKAGAAAAARAALEGAGDEARRLAVRTSTLVAQLAHERQSKKVRSCAVDMCECSSTLVAQLAHERQSKQVRAGHVSLSRLATKPCPALLSKALSRMFRCLVAGLRAAALPKKVVSGRQLWIR